MVTFSYRASTESLHFVEDFENNLADLLLSYSSGTLFPTSGFLNTLRSKYEASTVLKILIIAKVVIL